MSVIIQLSKGFSAIVDDEDAHLAELNWYAHISGRKGSKKNYAVRDGPRCHGKKAIILHRVLLGLQDLETGKKLSELVGDHINGDSLDNRRSNLRAVTQRQNVRNRQGTRNVYFNRRIGKWQAWIGVVADSEVQALRIAAAMREAADRALGE